MDKRKVSLEDILDKRRITPIFQAIVSLKDGEILGYESLSRIVGESYFDSIVGLFDTADVCQRFKELESLCLSKSIEVGHSFFSASSSNGKLFLNVNPNMINDASFKAAFSPRALEKNGFAPSAIAFEITERHVILDHERYLENITYFKTLGVSFAMDDVGSGYSGLNRIACTAPHYVKLDMDLIRDIDKNNIKQALVRGMAEFSRQSNIPLVAEGIENYEELKTIIGLGVAYAQGYYLNQPSPMPSPLDKEKVQLIKKLNGF